MRTFYPAFQPPFTTLLIIIEVMDPPHSTSLFLNFISVNILDEMNLSSAHHQMYDFKKRFVDPMIAEQKAAGSRGADAFTNDAIAVLFLLKAHLNLSYR